MRATGGRVSWAEARAMGVYERKAFLYCAQQFEGGTVNWSTGQIKFPT